MQSCIACWRRAGRRSGRVEAAFPGVRDEAGGIDRGCSGSAFSAIRRRCARLEAILHPMVARPRQRFLRRARGRGGNRWSCSTFRCCSKPAAERGAIMCSSSRRRALVQRQRVMRRPGMTESRFARHSARSRCRIARSGGGPISSCRRGLGRALTLRRCGDRQAGCEPRDWRRQRAARRLDGGDGNARNRARHRNHRSRPARRASHRRGRLHRAGSPRPDRPQISPLRQSRARHAGRGARGARHHRRVPRGPAALCRRSPTNCWPLSARTGWSFTMPSSTSLFSMPSWRGCGRPDSGLRLCRYARVGARALSRRAGQPRRVVPPL